MHVMRFLFAAALLAPLVRLPAETPPKEEPQTEDPAPVSKLLLEADRLTRRGDYDAALAIAKRAAASDPKSVDAAAAIGMIQALKRDYKAAIDAFNGALKLDPERGRLYDRRGDQYFKLGEFNKAIDDYDAFLRREPRHARSHWRRGIAYYYAGEYDKGRLQFRGYQKFDSNDVENAVWHYLCIARAHGTELAQKSMLKIGDDRRVPMRQIYELFAGRLKPAAVLETARAGDPSSEDLNRRLFYAHLYLGLYWQVKKDPEKERQHIALAAEKHRIGHFMWDVARVHAETWKRRGRADTPKGGDSEKKRP